eukprot:1156236-Pelagomonas_calceolata.AAC.6
MHEAWCSMATLLPTLTGSNAARLATPQTPTCAMMASRPHSASHSSIEWLVSTTPRPAHATVSTTCQHHLSAPLVSTTLRPAHARISTTCQHHTVACARNS